MQRVTFDHPHPLHDLQATRRIEAAGITATGPHVLMERAGASVARLAQALAPHARLIWIACGAGNNGGDGLEAAALLHARGFRVQVSWLGSVEKASTDTLKSWHRAVAAGVPFVDEPPYDLDDQDLCIDALLGIGLTPHDNGRRPSAALRLLLDTVHGTRATVLCVDLPSGLIADSGQWAAGFEPPPSPPAAPRHTLSLLTLKPGLFTGMGRDAAGTVWLDDLQLPSPDAAPRAWLACAPHGIHPSRPHASHKGSWGDVAVVGGEGLEERGMGMTGAALLAASAALHAGAGRVMLSTLDPAVTQPPALAPEIMLRRFEKLDLETATIVCGCGGGDAVKTVLPQILKTARRLVLDADALNAIATDAGMQALLAQRARHAGFITAMTPHPLETARLLGSDTRTVQSDRIAAARELAERHGCIAVLKGSGSIIAAPGETPFINPTGNARLATGGTGDVLAGLLGARIAALDNTQDGLVRRAFLAACQACWQHGRAADDDKIFSRGLTASGLARALSPM